MKIKALLFSALLFSASGLMAQTLPADPFVVYANKQSKLMQAAYEQRDADTDLKLIEDFTAKYNQLDADDKRMYKPYITGAYYNLSCIYALKNEKPAALQYLDSAVTRGYTNYSHLMEDADFAGIKDDPGFIKLSNNVRAVGDYKYILQRANKYNPADVRQVPAFTYQAANDPDLVALRKKFKLDSVAGKGDEASKAINLLKWVHNTVNHDGQHESGIKLINANEIIATATAKKIGVSCGELATTLNECYLAMGWKSRKVYCFPKDSLNVDYDSHVINMVYLPSLSKWVWMDPTNNAYVMDENKKLLGLAEVRERLVNNKPLAINGDANWNNRSKITKDFYLDYYMAKNLYMVYSPAKSEYNYETRDPYKTLTYVYLLPLDYYKQTPAKVETKNKETGLTIVRYKSNNPGVFWQAPPK